MKFESDDSGGLPGRQRTLRPSREPASRGMADRLLRVMRPIIWSPSLDCSHVTGCCTERGRRRWRRYRGEEGRKEGGEGGEMEERMKGGRKEEMEERGRRDEGEREDWGCDN